MITCTENCKYQKNGECTYEEVHSSELNSIISNTTHTPQNSNCVYFEQE